jgi:3-phenylpropionate/cinnamic acid dioxygenase small subunit
MENMMDAKRRTGTFLIAMAATIAAMPALCLAQTRDSIEQRLQRIEDRMAIEQLIVGEYPRALDSANWKAYAATFAADGELVQGTEVVKGPAAIEANFSSPRAARPASTCPPPPANATGAAAVQRTDSRPINKHVISNLWIKELSGDRAVATAYWETISTRCGQSTVAGAGHYEDVLKRENGKWKFARREIVNPARAGNPASAASGSTPPAQVPVR